MDNKFGNIKTLLWTFLRIPCNVTHSIIVKIPYVLCDITYFLRNLYSAIYIVILVIRFVSLTCMHIKQFNAKEKEIYKKTSF